MKCSSACVPEHGSFAFRRATSPMDDIFGPPASLYVRQEPEVINAKDGEDSFLLLINPARPGVQLRHVAAERLRGSLERQGLVDDLLRPSVVATEERRTFGQGLARPQDKGQGDACAWIHQTSMGDETHSAGVPSAKRQEGTEGAEDLGLRVALLGGLGLNTLISIHTSLTHMGARWKLVM